MNIKIPFDYNCNIDDVNIILKNNSLNNIGNIVNFNNFNLKLCFNSPNEISFDVYKESNNEYWNYIKDLAIIHIEELNSNFKIYVSIDDGDQTIKHVVGNSLCEDELSHIKLYDIQINTSSDILREDYTTPTVFCNLTNHKISLLHRILEKIPHYNIEYIDDTLFNLQYAFEFNDISIYDALIEISNKTRCVFVFDSNTRTINAYDIMNYCIDCNKRFDEHTQSCPYCNSTNVKQGLGNDTCITVSSDNIANMVSLDGNEDNYINCLRLRTGDEYIDATIRNIMPNGSEYIYYFDKNILEDMPEKLINKINEYNKNNKYYINDYVLEFRNNELKNKYNQLVEKYNNNPYKIRDYDENGNSIVKNNSYIPIDDTIKGFNKIANVLYDNIDFSMYIEHSLMPIISINEITIDDDVENLTSNNLSPFSLSELNQNTTKSTIEIFLKKYCNLYLKNSYIVSFEDSEYDYEGENSDGWCYGNWSGKIRITTYGDNSETRITNHLYLKVTNNYELFLEEKVKTVIKEQDDEVGSIYNILKITDDNEFKLALKEYSSQRLAAFYDAYKTGLDVMIEADQANDQSDFYKPIYLPLYKKYTFIDDELKLRQNELEVINDVQYELEKIINSIQSSLNMEECFGSDLWKLLKTYIREDVYTNDNITSEGLSNKEVIDLANEVIELANKNIREIGYIQKTISCSLNNFLCIPEFNMYNDEFNLGNWIVTEIDNKLYYNRFIALNIDISDGNIEISIELSQVTSSEDELSDAKSILNQANSIAGSIGEIKSKVEQSYNNNKIIKSWIQDGLDLTNIKIMSSAKNQSVIYDKNGLLVRSVDNITGDFLPEQLKIINSTIAITDDNWRSVKTAIGRFNYVDPVTLEQKTAYGINSEVLIGNLLIGQGLIIKTNDDSFVIGDNGLIIDTNTTTSKKELFTISKNGVKKLYIDNNGDIVGNDITINNLVANDGYFSGRIDATNGKIGGWNIQEDRLYISQPNSEDIFMELVPNEMTIAMKSGKAFSKWDMNGMTFSDEVNNIKEDLLLTYDVISRKHYEYFDNGTFVTKNMDIYYDCLLFSDEAHGSSGFYGMHSLSYTYGATKTIFIDGCEGSITAIGNIRSNTQITTSDKRLKENINSLDISCLIDEINVYSFDFISGRKNNIGVIANDYLDNEFAKYFIEEFERNNTIYYGVNYQVFIMAAIQKIQKLEKRIKKLESM